MNFLNKGRPGLKPTFTRNPKLPLLLGAPEVSGWVAPGRGLHLDQTSLGEP